MYRILFLAMVCVTASARAQTAPIWHLQLDHAIRPAEGSVGAIGDVAYVAVTAHGDVYVAEREVPRVTHYDAHGNFVGVVMRTGEGPKETREPAIATRGDTLVVYDHALTRLSLIAPSGKVLSERHLDTHASSAPIWITRDGSIVLEYGWTRSGFTQSAIRIRSTGATDTLGWRERMSDHQYLEWIFPGGVMKGGPYSAAPSATIDPLGRVVFGGSRRSLWYVVSGRDTVQRVMLPDHSVTIPQPVRDSVWAAFLARFAATPAIAKALNKDQLPTTLAAWISLDITPRGEWWIGRPGMDGKLASWDIVANGKLVGHTVAPTRILQGPGTYGKAFGSDLIALAQEDENDVPWIGVYRIVRN